MTAVIRVLFVLLPNSLALDWAGPAEALRMANEELARLGHAQRFRIEFVGPEANPVSSVGLGLCGVAPFPEPGPLGDSGETWVVLPGQTGARIELQNPANAAAVRWLRRLRLASGRLELICICAGSVLAGHAGLLDGLEATTHHHHLQELKAVAPACQVVENRVFVPGDAVWSSAGVTTGVDLMLHRIAGVCGAVVAARVAECLVVALRRGPGDPELSPFLAHRHHLHPALHRVQDRICQTPRDDWSISRMAKAAHTSPRHLGRLFRDHAGITPLDYLRRIRLAAAEAALLSGASVGRAAELAGFSSDAQLRRTWRQLGQATQGPGEMRGRGQAAFQP
jgi:transcriptional regulator GlxA family with amidase domain